MLTRWWYPECWFLQTGTIGGLAPIWTRTEPILKSSPSGLSCLGLKQADLLGPLQFTPLPSSRAWPVLIEGRAGGIPNGMWLVRESIVPHQLCSVGGAYWLCAQHAYWLETMPQFCSPRLWGPRRQELCDMLLLWALSEPRLSTRDVMEHAL